MDKILAFNSANVDPIYGECDIELANSETTHSIAFTADQLVKKKEYNVCLSCAKAILLKRIPSERANMINLNSLNEEIHKKKLIVDLSYYLKYFCFAFNNNEDRVSEKDLDEVNVFMKNRNLISFERIEWDEYKEEVLKNEVLNLDVRIKNNMNKRDTKKASIMIPNL
jgi:hypothetical protein